MEKVEYALSTTEHMDMDGKQMNNKSLRKTDIRILPLWPTRKLISQHIAKISNWPGWMISINYYLLTICVTCHLHAQKNYNRQQQKEIVLLQVITVVTKMPNV